jgi:hypothetical protein
MPLRALRPTQRLLQRQNPSGMYLNMEDPEHARTKAFAIDLLRCSSRV